MENIKKVSILIPCYNHEHYVEHAIRSALEQSYSNVEVLVSDDCSPDNSKGVILSIKDERMKFFPFDRNLGVVHALNFLMERATGDFIVAIGSDDYLDESFVEVGLRYLENDNIGAVFSIPNRINENGELLESIHSDISSIASAGKGQMLRKLLSCGNVLFAPTAIIRKSVCDEIGLYNNSYRQTQDYDYWCRLLCMYNIIIIPEKLLYYRVFQRGNLSEYTANSFNRTLNEMTLMFKKLFEIIPESVFYDGFSDLIPAEYQDTGIPLEIKKYLVLRQLRPYDRNMILSSILYYESNIDANMLEHLSDGGEAIVKQFYADTGRKCYSINDSGTEKRTVSLLKKCALFIVFLSSLTQIVCFASLIMGTGLQWYADDIRWFFTTIIVSAIINIIVVFAIFAYKMFKKIKWAIESRK